LETAQKVAKSIYKSDMKVDMYLRTKDLAQAVHISVQQVRNYEASGFIPAVERSSSGYRRYTRQHLVALKTARHLIGAYGRPLAQQIMQAVHQGTLSTALALIDERHAELARTRLQLEQTLAALSILAAQLRSERHSHLSQVNSDIRLTKVDQQWIEVFNDIMDPTTIIDEFCRLRIRL
jgi:DNA-binding transcriptional MerR regulator